MQRLIAEFNVPTRKLPRRWAAPAPGDNLLRPWNSAASAGPGAPKALGDGHARALLALKGPAQTAVPVTGGPGFTVRDTEKLGRNKLKRRRDPPPGQETDPDVSRLERSLSEKLGQGGGGGQGKGGRLVNPLLEPGQLDGILAAYPLRDMPITGP